MTSMPCSQRNSESLASAPYKPAHLLRRPDKRASPHISSLRAQAPPSHLALCARRNARNGALRFKPIHLSQRAHLPPRYHCRPGLYPIRGQERRRPTLHLSPLRQHPATPAPVASAKGPSTPTIACIVTFVQAIWPLWVVAVAKAALGLKHHQFGTSVLAPPAP